MKSQADEWKHIIAKAAVESKLALRSDVGKLCDKWIDGKFNDSELICAFIALILKRS